MNLVESTKTSKATFAKHDPVICAAPGLFRSLKKGEREKAKLDVTYTFGDGEQARFVGFEPLGADDMLFLQGLVALGGTGGVLLHPEPASSKGQQLRLFLKPEFDAAEKNGLVVRENINTLLKTIGLTGGKKNYENLKASLTRLAAITIIRTSGSKHGSFHLLSFMLDEFDGRLLVALNPEITEAIIGKRYTRIEIAESSKLNSCARLIHQRLCAWINQGESKAIYIDTLCDYVWPDTNPTPSAMKTRRSTVRSEALPQLQEIGWSVSIEGRGRETKCIIGRPKTEQ